MRYFLLTTVVLLSAFLNQYAQPASEDEGKVVVETTIDDGDKSEKTVKVLSGMNIGDLQILIDSLLKSVDWTEGLSKLNIIQVPGTDGIETLNWMEFNDLDNFGDFPGFDEQMKWLKRNSKQEDKPFLGVIIDTEMETQRGIHIMDIVNGSAAEEAGLQKDDILLSIEDHKVNSLQDLVEALKQNSIGEVVEISYSRDGAESVTTATLKSLIESNYNVTSSFDKMLPECCKADPNCKHGPDKTYKAFIHQQRPRLGVYIENLDQEMIEDLKISDEKGVLVTKVLEDSAAKKMGIKINDVLVGLNSDEITDVEALHDVLGRQKLGEEITIELVRYGVKKSVKGMLFEFTRPSAIDRMIFFGDHED